MGLRQTMPMATRSPTSRRAAAVAWARVDPESEPARSTATARGRASIQERKETAAAAALPQEQARAPERVPRWGAERGRATPRAQADFRASRFAAAITGTDL